MTRTCCILYALAGIMGLLALILAALVWYDGTIMLFLQAAPLC